MKTFAVAIVMLALSIGAWFWLKEADVTTQQEAGHAQPVAIETKHQPVKIPEALPVANASQNAPDPFKVWREIATDHASHAGAALAWKDASVKTITTDLSGMNEALAANGQSPFRAEVVSVDCRHNSCIVELRFASFPTAFRFVDLFEENRFSLDYQKPFTFECPLKRYSMPREPEKEQTDFPVLLHFECPTAQSSSE